MKDSENLLQVESQLLRLDHEILMLKFKAEEADPDVMAEFYRYVHVLQEEYRSLETQLQALQKAKDDATKEQYSAMNNAMEEMNCLVSSIGMHIRIQLADRFSCRYPG
jgi:uncharacterized protein YlxW (UPF0749 family)